MGFDTYLLIDDRVLFDWRKYASYLPRLLFKHDQAIVGDEPEDSSPGVSIKYRTTARQALETLGLCGLGWHATVVAYSEIRVVGAGASGMYAAELWDAGDKDVAKKLSEFEELEPEADLVALGQVMAHQWREGSDDVVLLQSLSYDGDLPKPHDAAFSVREAAVGACLQNPFPAVRAAESFSVLDRDAPLLAWPLMVCTFLQHLPPNSEVVLDLTEDAKETHEVETVAQGREYAAHYWQKASEKLSGHAHAIGRLFSVLASFDNGLSRDFWFARAVELLGRLDTVARASDSFSATSRGNALEGLVDALIRTESPELRVVEKNYRTSEEEIDLLLSNSLQDPFWIAHHSPLILIECKNWKAKAGVPELRVFESKIRDRSALCRIGIFVSLSGFTRPFLDRLKAFQLTGGVIFAIDGAELRAIVESRVRLTDWLSAEGVRRSLGK
ncbi:restriction endonuclease [Micromonospora sp. STR1s_5]|nr:restriction endonuclease [Micromonospora sp. STR1s_5]